MLATYIYPPGATAANILADILAILTGTTDVNSLSASCDKTRTVIDASVRPAGWEVYDAFVGANAQCLRAPVADNPAQFKYMVLDTNTPGYIMTKVYETWDPAAHTGTFMAQTSSTATSHQPVNLTQYGRLDISASVRHTLFFGTCAGNTGNSNGSPTGVLERTRLSPWDTVAAGYPPFLFLVDVGGLNYEPRYPGPTGIDLSGSGATVYLRNYFGGGNVAPTMPPETMLPEGGRLLTFKHQLYPIGACRPANGHFGGDISELCDVFLTTHNSGIARFDTLVVDGKEYIIWTCANYRLAVRKG